MLSPYTWGSKLIAHNDEMCRRSNFGLMLTMQRQTVKRTTTLRYPLSLSKHHFARDCFCKSAIRLLLNRAPHYLQIGGDADDRLRCTVTPPQPSSILSILPRTIFSCPTLCKMISYSPSLEPSLTATLKLSDSAVATLW